MVGGSTSYLTVAGQRYDAGGYDGEMPEGSLGRCVRLAERRGTDAVLARVIPGCLWQLKSIFGNLMVNHHILFPSHFHAQSAQNLPHDSYPPHQLYSKKPNHDTIKAFPLLHPTTTPSQHTPPIHSPHPLSQTPHSHNYAFAIETPIEESHRTIQQ